MMEQLSSSRREWVSRKEELSEADGCLGVETLPAPSSVCVFVCVEVR